MATSRKTLLSTAGGLAAGGFGYALASGRSVGAALLWGVASAAVGLIVLWLATWTFGKSPPQDAPPR